MLVRINARPGQRVNAQLPETVIVDVAQVFAIEPVQLLEIELRVVPENLRQVEQLDDFAHRHLLAIVLRRPAEQAEIIQHRLRRVTVLGVMGERSAGVALAHLASVLVQDQRNVRVMRRLHAECVEERDVLRRVAQVIFATNDVRDAHLQIINHVHEVEHRLAIRTHDDEVRIDRLAVRQFAADIAHHQIGDRDRLPLHLELDRALVLVGQPTGQERFDAKLVVLAPLTLEVRSTVAFARPGGVAGDWSLVPFKPQPAQPLENHIDRLLRVARGVRVFNPQDERAARMPRIQPVEQRRTGTSNVKVAGRTRGKTDANFHSGCFQTRMDERRVKAWLTIAFALEAWQAASRGELHSDEKLQTSHFANHAAHL